jgi:hypothetical protein
MPLETGLQAIQLSPYRAGLAEPCSTHFQATSAFLICYFPVRLSPLSRSGGPEVSFLTSPVYGGDQTKRLRGAAMGALLP